MTVANRSTIAASIASLLADNSSGAISAADMRSVLTDILESAYNMVNNDNVVYALSGTALDPANGSIQTKTISASTTFTDSIAAGEWLALKLIDGDTEVVAYPTTTWFTAQGNTPPTLTVEDLLIFFKISSTLYGVYVGSAA